MGDELPWNTLHGEIYMKSMSPVSRSERRTDTRDVGPANGNRWGQGQNAVLHAPGYCWNFLEGKTSVCPGKFKHFCPKCSQVHASGIYTPGFRGPTKYVQGTTSGDIRTTSTNAAVPRTASAKPPAPPRREPGQGGN